VERVEIDDDSVAGADVYGLLAIKSAAGREHGWGETGAGLGCYWRQET
jgi:hypothetical protein